METLPPREHAHAHTKRRADADAAAPARKAPRLAASAEALVGRVAAQLRKRARDDADEHALAAAVADLDVAPDAPRKRARAAAPAPIQPTANSCEHIHACPSACACGRDLYTAEQVAEELRRALADAALAERWARADDAPSYIN